MCIRDSSYLIQNADKPIILTGAQQPISTMTQSYRRKISGMSAGDMPGVSLSRNTRLSSVRLNSLQQMC